MGKPHIETMSVLWYKNETLLKVHIEKNKASLEWPGLYVWTLVRVRKPNPQGETPTKSAATLEVLQCFFYKEFYQHQVHIIRKVSD